MIETEYDEYIKLTIRDGHYISWTCELCNKGMTYYSEISYRIFKAGYQIHKQIIHQEIVAYHRAEL